MQGRGTVFTSIAGLTICLPLVTVSNKQEPRKKSRFKPIQEARDSVIIVNEAGFSSKTRTIVNKSVFGYQQKQANFFSVERANDLTVLDVLRLTISALVGVWIVEDVIEELSIKGLCKPIIFVTTALSPFLELLDLVITLRQVEPTLGIIKLVVNFKEGKV